MPRPQFTLRALLVAMLVVGTFFGGVHFERERRRRQDEAVAERPIRYTRHFKIEGTEFDGPQSIICGAWEPDDKDRPLIKQWKKTD
ncbi:MAG: hypothetical protein ACREHD_01670 [Pirellulales bacterium]